MSDEPRIRIDQERLASLVERVLDGHPDEPQLRKAIELGATPAVVLPDDPDAPDARVTVLLVHELNLHEWNPDPLVIGDFPLEDVIERPQG